MKVLILTPWYPDTTNTNHGIFVQDQAKALSTRHEVMLIASKINYAKFSFRNFSLTTRTAKNLTEVSLFIDRSLPLFNQLNYFFVSIKQTLTIAKKFKPDIIHANIGYPGAYWAARVSKRLGVPFVITEHTKIENNFRSVFHRWLTLAGYRKAAQIITVSRWAAFLFTKYAIHNVIVVPNVVKYDQFSIIEKEETNRKVQIGFLGSLFSKNHTKGLDLLLAALAKTKFQFHLHVGGGGSMLSAYKEQAQQLNLGEACTFYGQLNPDQIVSFMSKLDFFVCSSRVESFGIAPLEAMAAGLPVLATDCGGPSEYINEENGMLVAKESVDALVGGLEQLNVRLNHFNRGKIRKFVIDHYSDHAFVERIEKIYERLI